MRLLRKRSGRLLILALLSATALGLHASGTLPMDFLNPLSYSGCAEIPARAEIPQSIGELPPIDHMILTKTSGRKKILFKRGDVIEITYEISKDETEELETLTFMGLDPNSRALGLLTEFGQVIAIEHNAVTSVTRVNEDRTLGAVLFPTLATVGGAGTGAIVGGAMGGHLGFAAVGAACMGAPALAAGLTVGLVRAGWDRKYKIESGEWRIEMPLYVPTPMEGPEEPKSTAHASVENGLDAGPDASVEKKGGSLQ